MMSAVDTGCLSDRDQFLTTIIERLGNCPSDFAEKMGFVQSSRNDEEPHLAAGVLLLLYFRSLKKASANGEFLLQLIKRSSKVTQPGDLSCPGGLLHEYWDPLLSPLITSGIIPILQGKARKYVQMRDTYTWRMITLFLTNAMREAWEETGLKPWNLLFLGPLPTYPLLLFKRIIFPLVGFVKKKWRFHPNPEVDSIVEIPLTVFFNEANYGIYNVDTSKELNSSRRGPREFPCLIIRNSQGKEDILWGATFYIIMNFLKIVLNFEIPDPHSKRIIKRTLEPEYLTGYQRRH